MHLIRGQHSDFKPLPASVVTLGNFDGFHRGHQALIRTVKEQADALAVPSVLITFEPQPKEFFTQDAVPRLTRFSEKYVLAKAFGLDYLYCVYFDENFSALPPDLFVQTVLLDQLGARVVVVGDDCRFGAKRAGDFALLEKLSQSLPFKPIKLSPILFEQVRISSTRVRRALELGRLEEVSALLGRPFSLRGKVVYGEQRGRDFGFPTANINLHRDCVPVSGVFVVRVRGLDRSYDGVANVGIRPTFNGTRVLLEVHLFDFQKEIYGKNLCVEFLFKIREEARYDSFEKLVAQIGQDVQEAKQYFQRMRS